MKSMYMWKREFNTEQRDRAAASGVAMSDGSFPIANREDLKNALRAIGRAKDYEAARRHIIARARALGAVAELPADWNVGKAVKGMWTDSFNPYHIRKW